MKKATTLLLCLALSACAIHAPMGKEVITTHYQDRTEISENKVREFAVTFGSKQKATADIRSKSEDWEITVGSASDQDSEQAMLNMLRTLSVLGQALGPMAISGPQPTVGQTMTETATEAVTERLLDELIPSPFGGNSE